MKKYIVHVNGTRYSISASSARKAVHGVLKSLIGVKTTEKMMPLVILVSYLGGLTMDKDVKELVKVIQGHDMECDAIPVSTCNQDCDGCLARDILKAGYILPSSDMKLITDEEVDQYCANKTDCPYDKKERDRLCRDCQRCTQEAQLLACKKAHAGMTKELIREIITEIQNADEPDGMAMCSDPYRYTVNKIVETLKAKYGG